MKEVKEQIALVRRLPKLLERLRKVEQILGSDPKSLPPES